MVGLQDEDMICHNVVGAEISSQLSRRKWTDELLTMHYSMRGVWTQYLPATRTSRASEQMLFAPVSFFTRLLPSLSLVSSRGVSSSINPLPHLTSPIVPSADASVDTAVNIHEGAYLGDRHFCVRTSARGDDGKIPKSRERQRHIRQYIV